MSDLTIPIGNRSGAKVTVFDLREDEFGSKCNCTCPNCGFPLLAIPGNKYRSAHFKHKAGNWHCHFDFDDELRDYIYDKLLGLKQFTASKDDLEYINVISKHLTRPEITPQLTKPKQISVLEKKEGKIRIRIDDVDFWIKLVFKKKDTSVDNEIIAITLPELINLNNLSEKDLDYIRALINLKCNEKLIARDRPIKEEKLISKQKLTQRVEYQPKTVPFNMRVLDPQTQTESKPALLCPLCKVGELGIKLNSRNNEPFFVCKNPDCDFRDTKVYDYQNGKAILAKEVYFNMSHPKL